MDVGRRQYGGASWRNKPFRPKQRPRSMLRVPTITRTARQIGAWLIDTNTAAGWKRSQVRASSPSLPVRPGPEEYMVHLEWGGAQGTPNRTFVIKFFPGYKQLPFRILGLSPLPNVIPSGKSFGQPVMRLKVGGEVGQCCGWFGGRSSHERPPAQPQTNVGGTCLASKLLTAPFRTHCGFNRVPGLVSRKTPVPPTPKRKWTGPASWA